MVTDKFNGERKMKNMKFSVLIATIILINSASHSSEIQEDKTSSDKATSASATLNQGLEELAAEHAKAAIQEQEAKKQKNPKNGIASSLPISYGWSERTKNIVLVSVGAVAGLVMYKLIWSDASDLAK